MTDTEKLDEILMLVRSMHEDIESIKTKVDEVVPEVKPILDQLTSSPMFRMIAGGKAKTRA